MMASIRKVRPALSQVGHILCYAGATSYVQSGEKPPTERSRTKGIIPMATNTLASVEEDVQIDGNRMLVNPSAPAYAR